MGRVRIVHNRTALKEIQQQPEFERAMERKTHEVARAVELIAFTFRHTGYYMRRIYTRGRHVIAEDPFWHLIEYGSKNNPAYAPLRRGVIAAGLRLVSRQK